MTVARGHDYRPDLRGVGTARMPGRRSASKSKVTLICRSSPEPQREIGPDLFENPGPIRFRSSTNYLAAFVFRVAAVFLSRGAEP
jgi:hypothetical protein